eukprot:1472780-Prymnesium_polylepis.2
MRTHLRGFLWYPSAGAPDERAVPHCVRRCPDACEQREDNGSEAHFAWQSNAAGLAEKGPAGDCNAIGNNRV